jgi:hypothetical protein
LDSRKLSLAVDHDHGNGVIARTIAIVSRPRTHHTIALALLDISPQRYNLRENGCNTHQSPSFGAAAVRVCRA